MRKKKNQNAAALASGSLATRNLARRRVSQLRFDDMIVVPPMNCAFHAPLL
jgi:hypothetical protein